MPNIFGSLPPIRSCVTWLHVSPSHLPICSDNLNPCWQHFILTTWHQGTLWRQGRDTGTRREHWSSICNEQRPEIPSVNWSRFSLAWESCDVIAPSLSAWQRDGVIPGQLRECHTLSHQDQFGHNHQNTQWNADWGGIQEFHHPQISKSILTWLRFIE